MAEDNTKVVPNEGDDVVKEPPKPSRRDALRKRMKDKYPDMDFDDEETYAGRISDDMDDYENQIGKYRNSEKELSDLFSRDPRSAEFLSSWGKGNDPLIEAVRTYGDEFTDALQDPEKLEELAKARAEYLDKVSEGKKLNDEWMKNMQESFDRIDAFVAKNNIPEEKADDIFNKLQSIGDDILMGKYTDEALEFAYKAINHDVDVDAAQRRGEIDGKNAKINAQLKHAKRGDGTAGGGDGGMPVTPKDKQQTKRDKIFELASMAQ